MSALPAWRWALLVVMALSCQASAQTLEAMVVARDGEGEAAACARAGEELREQGVAFLVRDSANLREYHRLLDAYDWQGRSRRHLDQDLAVLMAQAPMTELSRYWSGKSCLIRGYIDADPHPYVAALLKEAERPPTPDRASNQADTDWLAMPRVAMEKFRNQRLLATALTELSVVKMVVVEHWMETGRWPRSLSDMRLSADDFANSQVLDQVSMGEAGAIRGRFRSPLGGETITLTPEPGGMGVIGWSCRSTVPVLFGSGCSE